MSQKNISIILCTALAAGAAVATVPAMAAPAQHGLVATVASAPVDEESISIQFPSTSIQQGERFDFSVAATSPDGDYNGLFEHKWTLPDGVYVDSPDLSAPVWPPKNDFILTAGTFAELGEAEIVLEGVVHGAGDARFPVRTTATIEIVENDPSDDRPNFPDVSLNFATQQLNVAAGGESSMKVTASAKDGGDVVADKISIVAPEGLTATVDKLGVKFPSTFNIDVAADSGLAPGRYEVGVAAKLHPKRGGGYSLRWTGTFPVVVGGDGGGDDDATPAPVTKCSATDDARVRLWEWWPTTRRAQISGCDRSGDANASVAVDIDHQRPSDLRLTLISPDGASFLLRDAGDTSDADATYSVDLSGEQADGTWVLKAEDTKWGRSGVLNSWTLTL